jgi:glycosyltransferase involved in cell wall biosynthesis
MNIAFLDTITWDYDIAAPYERPLGGSQSALCYLAAAMAGRGHAVTTYTGTTKPRDIQGVHCRSLAQFNKAELAAANHDVMIVLNGPAASCLVARPQLPARCRLILWTQHAHDQPAMAALATAGIRALWDRIVCVSQWHAATMQQRFGLDPQRLMILRNAISPAFANLFPDMATMVAAKAGVPALAYTSTPFRGLNLLPAIFPHVHQLDARIRLRIYSSMKVYGVDSAKDEYGQLYAHFQSMPGVEFVGSLPQPELAAALKQAMILAYPNTFAETSCIAVMEAMAAGLLVVTSDLGALPETTMGRAVWVRGVQGQGDAQRFMQAYTQQLLSTLRTIASHPPQFYQMLWEQVRAVNAQYTWAIRASEWEQYLQSTL